MTEAEDSLILPKDIDSRSTVEAVRTRLEKKQGGAEFSITLGDITEADVDAIVCPSNPGLEFAGFGGVQLAISKKSGMETFQEAERKAQEYVRTTGGVASDEGLRGVPLGFASATTAGELRRIKSIIHVNSMRSERGKSPCDEEVVRLSVSSALTEADRAGLKSVAFPAIGTGIWGMSLEESLRGTVQGVKDHFDAQPDSKVEKATFVVYAPATSENARSLQETLFNRVLLSFSKK